MLNEGYAILDTDENGKPTIEAYFTSTYTEYYEKGKEKLWFIHEDTKAQLEYLLKMLAVKGEEATLAYIKNVYLKGKGRFGGKGDTYVKVPWSSRRGQE